MDTIQPHVKIKWRKVTGLYCLSFKNDLFVLQEIFYDENQKDYSCKKAAKKRRKHIVAKKMKQALNTLNLQEHDDVSRETFASDTNEALESLEEVPEDEPEPALGTEDSPVVYNSNDLEVFWCMLLCLSGTVWVLLCFFGQSPAKMIIHDQTVP